MLYIGMTKWKIKTRIKEHIKNINEDPERYTGLTLHRVQTSHNFDYKSVKILAVEKNHKKRKVIENYYIKITKNTVNIRFEESNLPQIYNSLIQTNLKYYK